MKLRIATITLFWSFTMAAAAFAQQEYNLSQVANGRFGSGSFRTTFVLFNPNNTTVIVEIQLSDDKGEPLTVTIPGLGTDDDFSVTLQPGGTRILQTDGSGNLIAGAALVTATASIGVSAIFSLFDTNGNFVTEAGVGSSEPMTEFVIPVDVTGSFNTGVALFNIGSGSASITVRLLDLSGQEVARTTLTLDEFNHLARFVAGPGQLFPNISNFRGTLVVSSSVAIAAVALRQNDSPLSYTSLPAVPRSSSKTEFNLAQVANGSFAQGSFRTAFLIFNVSASQANVELSLSKDDGSAFAVNIPGRGTASTFNLALAPGASAFLQTDGAGPLAAGAARIISNLPIGASAIFSVFDSQGSFQTEAGVGDSPVLTELTIPVDITGKFDTGVAFYNSGSSTINLSIRLLNQNGNLTGTVALTLNGKNHTARFVTQLFPGATNFRGSLSITSSGGLSALTLRQNETPLSYTTLPVARGAALGTSEVAPLLSRTRSGVSVSGDITVNETLAVGFRLTGRITGAPGLTIIARSGSDIYSGIINLDTQRYLLVLPAGTYNLTVCFELSSSLTSDVGTEFSDPVPVQVSGDTTRDIILPAVSVFNVSGTVASLTSIPSATGASIVFTSSDNKSQGTFLLGPGGSYQGQLPNGSYVVGVVAEVQLGGVPLPENLEIYDLGMVTVSASSVIADFTAPATARLSGTVNAPGFSPIPLGSFIAAADAAAPLITTFVCAFPPSSSSASVGSAGTYELVLAVNRNYDPAFFLPLTFGPNDIGIVLAPVSGSRINLSGDTTRNFSLPMLPAQATITGKVTDSSGRGVADVGVGAFTQDLAGAPNVAFLGGATTDSDGNYRFIVLRGTNYILTFQPRLPEP